MFTYKLACADKGTVPSALIYCMANLLAMPRPAAQSRQNKQASTMILHSSDV